MKRHVQQTGIRDWYGADILDLQGESLKVIDGLLSQYGAFVVSGCQVTANDSRFNVAAGIVALKGTDPEGQPVSIAVPFEGVVDKALPLYLTMTCEVVQDQYNDGNTKPIAYNYKAVASSLQPGSGVSYIEIKQTGTLRFTDAIQDAMHRFITDTERTVWNAKETPAGAQSKADASLASAKAYTDTREMAILSAADAKDATTLASAKTYTDTAVAGIALTLPIVNISDFETFNPSTSLVDSITGKTFTLAEGESCQFKSAYGANGKPWMGSGTLGATNNALSTIYYWSGTITRIYSTYYMVTAYGANTTTGRPQEATRLYYGSNRYDWVVNTDYSSRSTTGYMKLPSGVMIQWGKLTSNAADQTVTFPLAFSSVYSILTTITADTNTNNAGSARVLDDSTTMSSFRVKVYYSSSSWTNGFMWLAIGTWK